MSSPPLLDSFFRSVFDQSGDAQFVLDARTQRFEAVNAAFLELSGYGAEELAAAGMSAGRLLSQPGQSLFEEPPEPARLEARLTAKDGQERAVELTLRRLERDGRAFWFGSVKDLTAAKRSQRELWGRIQELGMANSRIFALTEKLRRVPTLAPRLLNATDERELFSQAAELLCGREGLGYAQVRFYIEREGFLKAVGGRGGARTGRRIAADSDQRAAKIFRGDEPPMVTPREALVALKGRDAPLGVMEVKFDPQEIEALKGNERTLTGYFDLLGTMANTLGLLLENLRLSELLRRQAVTDMLTGVSNRRHLAERLGEEVQRCARYERPLSLMMIDVDHFKQVNDTRGHRQGDLVLAGLARLLRGMTREVDTVCRYGGDEFVVMLPETELPDALGKAEALRRAVEALQFVGEGPAEPQGVTVSIGVAGYRRGRGEEELLREADEALYAAKRTGRNRVCTVGGMAGAEAV
jgi:diguanylate cyclase (GGDEF)-like protein/PAS domain S-box-containing protein